MGPFHDAVLRKNKESNSRSDLFVEMALRGGETTEAWERGVMLMVSQCCLTSLGCIYYEANQIMGD